MRASRKQIETRRGTKASSQVQDECDRLGDVIQQSRVSGYGIPLEVCSPIPEPSVRFRAEVPVVIARAERQIPAAYVLLLERIECRAPCGRIRHQMISAKIVVRGVLARCPEDAVQGTQGVMQVRFRRVRFLPHPESSGRGRCGVVFRPPVGLVPSSPFQTRSPQPCRQIEVYPIIIGAGVAGKRRV